jgi:hypothetical protein
MDNNNNKLSPRVLKDSNSIDSHESNKNQESKMQHGSSIDKLRMLMYGQEHIHSIEPVKPMRYVRHFTVSVSLKKSRLLRFFLSIKCLLYFLFDYSRNNVHTKQWPIGKKQFNDNPKEVKGY